MDDSILVSVKKMLGIEQECVEFDFEIMMHINSAFTTFYQLGIEANYYGINASDETWANVFGDIDKNLLNLIKTCTYSKVRLAFDPPTTSFVLDALNNQIKEQEWRIYIATGGGFDDGNE